MKATGIVRRVDDLGRVVIPKELRNSLRIREGEPLEIFVTSKGQIILQKYSPMKQIEELAEAYATSLFNGSAYNVIITDLDEVVAVAGLPKKFWLGSRLSDDIRETVDSVTQQEIDADEEWMLGPILSVPVVANGDCVGTVNLVPKANDGFDEVGHILANTAAMFIGRYLES